MYLSFDQEMVTNVFSTLADIEASTGLKVSYEKTTMYRVGFIAHSDAKLYTPCRVMWSNDYINTLGINISNDIDIRNAIFKDTIAKVQTISNMWYYRSMSLLGKVTVVNSLMASLFVYKMQISTEIQECDIKEFEQIVVNFIWNGKKPKIDLRTLQCNREDGGLGLVNIRTKHQALLCTWIRDAIDYPDIRNLAEYYLGNNMKVWCYNLTGSDSQKMYPGDNFLAQITTFMARLLIPQTTEWM